MLLFEHYLQKIKTTMKAVDFVTPVTEQPEEWKTTYAKTYPRFALIPLETPSTVPKPADLWSVLKSRRSASSFDKDISKSKLSMWLYYSLGTVTDTKSLPAEAPRRMHPSAGGYYPLEAYLLLLRPIDDISPGVYHYDLRHHGLRLINPDTITSQELATVTAQDHFATAQGVLLLTAVWQRSAKKYGERAYKHILIETGTIIQNAALAATALEFNTCQAGVFANDLIEPLLGIDGYQEAHIHSLCFG